MGKNDHLYVYNSRSEKVEIAEENFILRVLGDKFLLQYVTSYEKDELPWGFVLSSVNSVPYLKNLEAIILEIDEGDTLVFNNDLLPAEDPDKTSEIMYRFDWGNDEIIEWDTDWSTEVEHAFEDDDNYGRILSVQLSDGVSECEIQQVPLLVNNVPPNPFIDRKELPTSSIGEVTIPANMPFKFTIYAGDPAGVLDQPYTYQVEITGHGDSEGDVEITELADDVYSAEPVQGGIKHDFERELSEGRYTLKATVADDSGASGYTEISFVVIERNVSARIIELISWPTGTYGPGDQVAVQYTVENNGTESHEFYMGCSVRGPDNLWQHIPYVNRSLDPGESVSNSFAWTVPDTAPEGLYDVTIAVWEDVEDKNGTIIDGYSNQRYPYQSTGSND